LPIWRNGRSRDDVTNALDLFHGEAVAVECKFNAKENRFHLLAARVTNGNWKQLEELLTENEKGNTMNQEERGKKMSQLLAKCWADEGFKRKLLAELGMLARGAEALAAKFKG